MNLFRLKEELLKSNREASRKCVILDKVDDLIARGYITGKRPNPKARKRLNQKLNK